MRATDPTLLLPDFALIVVGWLLLRTRLAERSVWDGIERLVYHVLFPALLFTSILRHSFHTATVLPLAASAALLIGGGALLALALGRVPGVDARLHASGAQVAFRFNSYVALALAERIAGAQGLAWMALIIAVAVPLANLAAVWPLARVGGHGFVRELARNPLILATTAGLLCNAVGLKLPELVATTLTRVGSAALPLGLMAVGAGLRIGALREGPRLGAALLGIRHLVLPALGIALALAFALPAPQAAVLVAFAAMPTASSCYVLAVRMGGNSGYVSGLITVSTLLAMAGLPLALAALAFVTR